MRYDENSEISLKAHVLEHYATSATDKEGKPIKVLDQKSAQEATAGILYGLGLMKSMDYEKY
eukprot:CAMPEP_0170499974 /NCGR_PEP_ID=MMETSP0208-20121228/33270_1 /TAXON_ID=197538 /ORGANISM="Strombidium inclinatum, Strain S3" /LENGTH=61 /DNA_ID=CAMNT_0010777783 /DNA_START=159 /DNA_END=341 /DNA_ORIENTATION=-